MKRNTLREEEIINNFVIGLTHKYQSSQIQRLLVKRTLKYFFDHLEKLDRKSIDDFDKKDIAHFIIKNFSKDGYYPQEHFLEFTHFLLSEKNEEN